MSHTKKDLLASPMATLPPPPPSMKIKIRKHFRCPLNTLCEHRIYSDAQSKFWFTWSRNKVLHWTQLGTAWNSLSLDFFVCLFFQHTTLGCSTLVSRKFWCSVLKVCTWNAFSLFRFLHFPLRGSVGLGTFQGKCCSMYSMWRIYELGQWDVITA